ncbi:MAG: FkbM family methyltransferase [Bacteroidales bacterium]|nr:FkbM family methyltransferase [Bacteroidales bacterium]
MIALKQRISFWKKVLLGEEVYYKPQVKRNAGWIGSEACGFYVVPDNLTSASVVYSFGVGIDISFDEELIRRFSCKVYAFDPTPKSKLFVEGTQHSDRFCFFDCGLMDYDGNIKFYLPDNPEYVSCTTFNRWGYDEELRKPIEVPVKRLSTIMSELGHDRIDLLKMDIEGSEYCVIDDILKSQIPVKQLLVEFHHRFPNIGIKKTKDIILKLNNAGYRIAAISDSKEEYTFIKTNS